MSAILNHLLTCFTPPTPSFFRDAFQTLTTYDNCLVTPSKL